MRKKRTNSTTENAKDDSTKSKKFKTDSQKVNVENKKDEKQVSDAQSNEANARHSLSININKDILQKGDEAFFSLFKGSQSIALGRSFFVTYGSEKEAQTKLKELSGKVYKGSPLKVNYRKTNSKKEQKQKPQLGDFAKLILSKVPLSATYETLKKSFGNADKILKRKKKGKQDFKSFVLFYSEKSQAEQDLIRSEDILVDGEKIEASLAGSTLSPPNKKANADESNPASKLKTKEKNGTEEPSLSAGQKKKQRKRKAMKS